MSTATDRAVTVGVVDDLCPGEGRAYAVDGRQVAVFRMTDGSFRATDAVCPHRAGPIADGQFDQEQVMCPLHQYAFRFSDGGCSSATIGALPVYRTEQRNGDIIVWL